MKDNNPYSLSYVYDFIDSVPSAAGGCSTGDVALNGTVKKFGTTTTVAYPNEGFRACNCVGTQNGEPRCPCAMRSVKIRDGRYVQPEADLGPVPDHLRKDP